MRTLLATAALALAVILSGAASAQALDCRVLLAGSNTAQHEATIVVPPSTPVTLEVHCLGTSQPTYHWATGQTGFSIVANAPPTPGAQQAYQVTVTLNGLSVPLTGTIRSAANGTPVCTVTRNPAGDVRVFTNVTITANCPGATSYAWTGGYDLRGQGTSQVVHVNILNQPSNFPVAIDVTASNVNGTGAAAGTSIRYTLAPPSCRILANPSGTVAPGTPVTLTAQCDGGSVGYAWNTGGFNSSVVVAPVTTTVYRVTATNEAGPGVTASYTLGVAAVAPGLRNYTGHWWAGEAENGWGMTLNQHDQAIFGVVYFYDATGEPTWAVMPAGSWNANFTAYTGELYTPHGTPYTDYDPNQLIAGAPTGTMTLTFTSPTAASVSFQLGYSPWDHNGPAIATYGMKQVTPLIVNAGASPGGLGVADMWWGGPSQNGWGISVNQRDSQVFAAWFTYGLDRRPIWFILSGDTWTANTAGMAILRVTGNPWLGVPFVPKTQTPTTMGAAAFNFADPANATFNYDITNASAGATTAPATGSKPIVRQSF
jgi:hypothetical protein